MTPTAKETALELCQNFGRTTMFSDDNNGYTLSLETAKKCAIISIDGIQKELTQFAEQTHEAQNTSYQNRMDYWDEVKQEIQKL